MRTTAYRHTQRPEFLRGCFCWKGRGYHYSGTAPEVVFSLEGCSNGDPWIALAAVMESAKRGDYGQISQLRKWILDEGSAPTLVSACLGLIADAGLDADLEFLAELMIDAPDYLRVEASLAAQWSGVVWLIPFMVEAWCSLDRRADRDAFEANISNLLDAREGEPAFFDTGLGKADYRKAVEARLADVRETYGTDRVAILAGEPVDMHKQVWLMRKALTRKANDGWIDWSDFLLWRRKLEVYSGVDCSGFYAENADFLPRSAAAILDKYMSLPLQFDVGERYFFGSLVR